MLIASQSHSAAVPLYSTVLECEVIDSLASLKLTERFLNDSEDPLECILRMPMAQDAALVDLTITTDDGRVMKATVEDKDTAREQYSDAISAGHTATLGEVQDEKEFTLSIGNLAPHCGLQAVLSLVAPLSSCDGKWLFAVPQWVTSSWSKPPISLAAFRSLSAEAQRDTFSFQVTLRQRTPIRSLSSPSHTITAEFDENRLRARVWLKAWEAARTIELRFETQADIKPKLQTQLDSATGEYVGMLSFIPPLLEAGQTTEDVEGKGDFVLLLDRSGSMDGTPIEMAKQAAIIFIKSLSEGNKFNVISFGSGHAKLFPSSQPVTPQSVKEAVAQLSVFTADMGGTDILRPLRAVYEEESDMSRSLYLLTDGEVENRNSVVQLIEQHSKQARVHAFGIGNGVDRNLIIEVAKAAKGCFEFISDLSEIKKKVVGVLKSALLPALSNLQVSWPSSAYEQFPSNKTLPVCYFGELVVAYVHYGTSPPQSGTASLSCVNTASGLKAEWELAIDTNASEGSGAHKLWAKQAIKELSVEYASTHGADCLARIKSLSKKYGVPCEHTSLLCVVTNAVEGTVQTRTIALGGCRDERYSYPILSSLGCNHSEDDEECCEMECCDNVSSEESQELVACSRSSGQVEEDISAPLVKPPVTQLAGLWWQAASLMEIIEMQEVDGLWLAATSTNLYAIIPPEFEALGESGLDLWTTLCVVMLLQVKFAQQAEEWELVVRKANRALRVAGVDIGAYAQGLEQELIKNGVVNS